MGTLALIFGQFRLVAQHENSLTIWRFDHNIMCLLGVTFLEFCNAFDVLNFILKSGFWGYLVSRVFSFKESLNENKWEAHIHLDPRPFLTKKGDRHIKVVSTRF